MAEKLGAPDDTFDMLRPGLFVGFHPDLYEAHCVQLCEAAKAGRPREPTMAELALMLSRTSEKAPLTADGARAYALCLREVSRSLPEGRHLRKGISEFLGDVDCSQHEFAS